jgi:hypothetical protein
MTISIDLESILSTIFVLVDDWHESQGKQLLKGKRGAKPNFKDSEVITLMLAMDFVPFPGETQFIGFIRANYLALFPKLLHQSQFNRRARGLRYLVEQLRQAWARHLLVTYETDFLLDTKPVPAMGYARSKQRSDFTKNATYGYCSSRKMHYFGYKLVMITTMKGVPVAYDLVSAHTDERVAAESVLPSLVNCAIWADKGFIGSDWQTKVYDQTGNRIWTVKRKNQHQQNPPAFDRLLNSVRERIESTFNTIQNTGRNLEHLLAKSVIGLCTRVIAKVTSHTLKLLLLRDFGIDVQTFHISEPELSF